MPRLTNAPYLAVHEALRQIWLEQSAVFGYVQSRDQWYPHRYFLPDKEVTNNELLAHRLAVTKDGYL